MYIEFIRFERKTSKYCCDCQGLAVGQMNERRGHDHKEINYRMKTEDNFMNVIKALRRNEITVHKPFNCLNAYRVIGAAVST